MSHEVSVTIQDQQTGQWVNVPSVVNGWTIPEHLIEEFYYKGTLPVHGRFNSIEEAEAAAKERSDNYRSPQEGTGKMPTTEYSYLPPEQQQTVLAHMARNYRNADQFQLHEMLLSDPMLSEQALTLAGLKDADSVDSKRQILDYAAGAGLERNIGSGGNVTSRRAGQQQQAAAPQAQTQTAPPVPRGRPTADPMMSPDLVDPAMTAGFGGPPNPATSDLFSPETVLSMEEMGFGPGSSAGVPVESAPAAGVDLIGTGPQAANVPSSEDGFLPWILAALGLTAANPLQEDVPIGPAGQNATGGPGPVIEGRESLPPPNAQISQAQETDTIPARGGSSEHVPAVRPRVRVPAGSNQPQVNPNKQDRAGKPLSPDGSDWPTIEEEGSRLDRGINQRVNSAFSPVDDGTIDLNRMILMMLRGAM